MRTQGPTLRSSHEDRRPRLLLVDDEPTNLQVLRQILGEEYRLQFATDGAKALQLAQQQRPDLILLDIMMPQMSGYEVCRELKRGMDTQGIPVIFVTALSELEDEEQGFDAGGVDYIIKPVRAPIVRARVKTHLSLVRADELRESLANRAALRARRGIQRQRNRHARDADDAFLPCAGAGRGVQPGVGG